MSEMRDFSFQRSGQRELEATLQSAMLEPDHAKVPRRIADARNAILDRVQDTLRDPTGEETRSLKDALQMLRFLEQEISRKHPAA